MHNVSVSGNCLAFCRLLVLVLCDMFLEQQNDVSPSPDCSLENSQLDLFDLISQFDIMSILKRGNAKKLAALEQRFHSKSAKVQSSDTPVGTSGIGGDFGTYPGSQSFFQSFLIIGSCSRLHCQMLDVLFECLTNLIEQLKLLDIEMSEKSENISTVRSVIVESRVISVLAKFAGFLYFLPYRDSRATDAMACSTHRTCPLPLETILTSVDSGFKLTLHLGWIAEFIFQNHYRHDDRGLATAHLSEFNSLSGLCDLFMRHLASLTSDHILKLVTYTHLMTIIECLPTRPAQRGTDEHCLKSDDVKLTAGDALLLAPQLHQLNSPLRIGQVTTVFQINRTLNESVNQSVNESSSSPAGSVSFQKKMEDAFFRSHSRSLQRTVEFVIERVTSNCVKDFRMHLIPDIIRDENTVVKAQLAEVAGVVDDEERKSLMEIFIGDAVTKCIHRAMRHSLAKSVEFCQKACCEALPALLGGDISPAVLQQAIKIAQRDTTEKCAG